MNQPIWIDLLRVLSLAGLSYGAWKGWRKRPPILRLNGAKYYHLPDGRFCNAWYKIVTDPARIAALQTAAAKGLGDGEKGLRSK